MLIVRCPACQTVFRVRPEQLRLRDGLVRCGHCYTPFNGLAHQIDEAAPELSSNSDAPRAAAITPAAVERAPRSQDAGRFFVLEERIKDALAPATATRPPRHEPAPPDAHTGAPPLTSRAAAHGFWSETAGADVPERPVREASPAPAPTPATTFDRVADRLEFEIPDTFLPSRSRPPAYEGDRLQAPPPQTTADAAAPRTDASPRPARPTDDDAWSVQSHADDATDVRPHAAAAPAIVAPQAIRYRNSAARDPQPADPAPLPTPEYTPPVRRKRPIPAAMRPPGEPEARSDARDYTAASRDGPRWLWGLAVGILGGALAVQAAYLLRLDITRHWPQLRPLYVELCEQFGCDMPLPRIAAEIRIVNSDLESDPHDPNRFVLNARIRNEARHPQEHPHLELTLTDARDRPVVRRVLTPAEWARSPEGTYGFRAGDEIAVHVPFAAPEVTTAVGYRLYAFYP